MWFLLLLLLSALLANNLPTYHGAPLGRPLWETDCPSPSSAHCSSSPDIPLALMSMPLTPLSLSRQSDDQSPSALLDLLAPPFRRQGLRDTYEQASYHGDEGLPFDPVVDALLTNILEFAKATGHVLLSEQRTEMQQGGASSHQAATASSHQHVSAPASRRRKATKRPTKRKVQTPAKHVHTPSRMPSKGNERLRQLLQENLEANQRQYAHSALIVRDTPHYQQGGDKQKTSLYEKQVRSKQEMP